MIIRELIKELQKHDPALLVEIAYENFCADEGMSNMEADIDKVELIKGTKINFVLIRGD